MHQFCQAPDGEDLPRAFDAEQAAFGLQRLLEAAGKCENQGLSVNLQRLADDPDGRALLTALFGNSPFLCQCAVREPEFAAELFESGPDAALAGISDALQSMAPNLADDGALKQAMRIAKRRAALAIAAADIARFWDQERVTRELSRFAEICVAKTANFLLARRRVAPEQSFRGHDHSRRAETALRPELFMKALLYRRQAAACGGALNCFNVETVATDRQRQAGMPGLAIDQHRAGAALAAVAADLGAGEP